MFPVVQQGPLDIQARDRMHIESAYDSPTLTSDIEHFVCASSLLIKIGPNGELRNRRFWVSSAGDSGPGPRTLSWYDPHGGTLLCHAPVHVLCLEDVTSIHLGATSQRFKRCPIEDSNPAYYRSFSLILRDTQHTVDIVADCLVDFEAWVLALARFCAVDPFWPCPMDIRNDPMKMKVPRAYHDACREHHISPTVYASMVTCIKAHRNKVRMYMQLYPFSMADVHKAVGGVHPPGVNAADAVYVTKGELRYFTAPHNIDIFRVSQLWLLLQQEGMIYDPGFAPPVDYGCTVRRPSSFATAEVVGGSKGCTMM